MTAARLPATFDRTPPTGATGSFAEPVLAIGTADMGSRTRRLADCNPAGDFAALQLPPSDTERGGHALEKEFYAIYYSTNIPYPGG